ncbi:MAG: valine--tRNA ligase [Candidatus Berkelbacteria bacterium]|nr:valine--tRNA ligase [Candidatus Berkelbacteria bacterium]
MELPKAYDPKAHETEIYKLWESSGAFTPKIERGKKPFVIMMPPPNVTGKLHIGHAMVVTLEDILTRYHRMKGEPTLWLPGTDHAGIATQNVVEKELKKEGESKRDLGREKFVERVWEWKKKYGGEIIRQTRALGASCDWTHERFTLDKGLSEAVDEAFKRLYDKGLIYQGLRTVNWCPHCHSAISDDEVEYKKEKGKFYHIKYGPFTLATARPETKLGDTAVAVHPSDKKYKDMVGKKYKIPGVLGEFEIVVVADNAVDPKFGTGAVKVTPAHSLVDFEIAQRHGVPLKQVIDENGKMMENTGKYAGMTTKETREAVVEDMKKMGLIEKIDESYEHNIGVCYRCSGVIEPIPSKQWFVKMKPLTEKAKEAVKSGKIKILPKRFEKVYFHWLDNIRDWCISRQLWWGHRIPVWYCGEPKTKRMGFAESVAAQLFKGKIKTYRLRDHGFQSGDRVVFEHSGTRRVLGHGVMKEVIKTVVKDLPLEDKGHYATYAKREELIAAFKRHNPEKEIVNDSPAYIYHYEFIPAEKLSRRCGEIIISNEKPEKCPTCGNTELSRDEDVLDTWFSSALWPFSTLGWPSSAKATDGKPTDYEYFYPTTVLETGYDILFFWVAKMIMMGLELTDKPPFETVYLHGLVRDEHNRKMSKSLGNVLDPLEVTEKYGTDAVRMSLVVGATAGNDLAVGESKIKGYRNFSNKIWNISRFVLTNLENPKGKINNLLDEDKKDLERLDEVIEKVTKHLDSFQFSRAGELLYNYIWHEFADIIIEQSKDRLNSNNEKDKRAVQTKLLTILTASLKMLHPFIPFVTETIWQKIPTNMRDSNTLISAKWPGVE